MLGDKMKKLELLLPISFFIVIFGMFVWHAFIPDQKVSEMENRNLTVLNKQPTMEQIFSGEYSKHLEEYFTDQFPKRDDWLKNYILLQKFTGKVYFNDKYYVEEDGWIAAKPVVEMEDESVRNFVNELTDISKELTAAGIPFTYYSFPAKATYILKAPDYMPEDVGQVRNQKVHELLKEQYVDEVRLIDYIDNTISVEEMYFKTDHHWTMRGAYAAYEALIRTLNERMDWALSPMPYDENNNVCLKNEFLGSWNKILAMTVEHDDQICYNEPIDFSEILTIYERTATREFQVDVEQIYGVAKGFDESRPVNYSEGYSRDFLELNIFNEKPQVDKHLVVIKDSYFNPIQFHVASHFRQLTVIDLRYFDKPLIEYLLEIQPDYVVLAYNDRNMNVYLKNE